jgi:hypothetical protein
MAGGGSGRGPATEMTMCLDGERGGEIGARRQGQGGRTRRSEGTTTSHR